MCSPTDSFNLCGDMDFFSYRPQKFYLLSSKYRRFFAYESSDRCLEHAVEEAFEKLPRIEGGNVYAVYRYGKIVLEVMTQLSEQMKAKYLNIQQLPSYFKQLKEGDVFIRHQAWAPLCDLKRSIIKLKAISGGRDAYQDDCMFMFNWARLYLKYETYSYGFLTDKICVGENDLEKRVCRFCQKSGKDRFKHESHAVMEALGNKLLITNEECDECNQAFENSVEMHLYKLLEINRTLSDISGKGSKNHHLEGLNFHIHPDKNTSLPVVYVKQEHLVNDVYRGKVTGKIYLYNKGKISYNGVYKALVKIAVDMIPSAQIAHFKDTGRWVHGDIDGANLPTFLYGEHQDFFEQPVLDFFFRKEDSPAFSPYCTAILYIFDSVFIYVLPYSDMDDAGFATGASLRKHWAFFRQYQYLKVEEWAELDSNDQTLLTPYYIIPVLGRNRKYRLEYRPSTDEVFQVKRK